MTKPLPYAAALFMLLLTLALPALAGQQTEHALDQLLGYLDRTWLAPNGLDRQYMLDDQPVDLAILLALALRSQTPHVDQDPGLQPALDQVAEEMRNYLGWLSGATRAAMDPWGNPLSRDTLVQVFDAALYTTNYDQYSIDAYGVDPLPLVHDDLLTPIATGAQEQPQTDPLAKFQAREDPDSIVLLGEESPAAESNAQVYNGPPAEPQPEPEPVTIDPVEERDILGNWRHKETGLLLVIRPGNKPGTYEGRFPNAVWEDWGQGLEFFTNNFQMKDSVLRVRFKQDTGWGLSYDGRLYGANDWDYPLTVNISRDDQNRLELGYTAANLNGGPYIRD